jgi:NAD(P)-dependent dehydrogenase (short-subunit alcohol dehydrogenase family)
LLQILSEGVSTFAHHALPSARAQRGTYNEGLPVAGRVEGKVALIVGAGCVGPGWGNGRAAAVLFAREGAKVFAVDKNADSMTETLERVGNDGEIAAHVCDVLEDAQVAAMTEACRKRFGRIDILVNNVGGSAAGGVAEMSEDNFDRQIDYNLKSVFLTCRHVIPVMVAQGGGAIVNTASTSGTRYTGSPQIGYASSKAAVIQFSRVTAVQYAKNRIRVNTVVPGQMHTPMVEARLAKQRTGGDVEALLKSRVARIPLGFMGDGRDTAHAVLFLASDEARFITGTEIVVDGGMTARCD